jgi:hypothetical protein
MMMRAEVVALSRLNADPAVSIVVPVRRAGPFHDAEELRVRQLVDEACGRVRSSYPRDKAEPVLARLASVAAQARVTPGSEGIALFASADVERVVDVPFPVDEQLTIEGMFSTRQLLAGMARRPHALVLVLSRYRARVFEERDGILIERGVAGFPVGVEPSREQDAPHRDLPIHEGAETERHRAFLRAADHALEALHLTASSALVVVGAERELAYFDEVSRHREHVIGRVRGNHVRAGTQEIDRLVRPVIDAWLDQREHELVAGVLDGVGSGRWVTDPAELWRDAVDGRARRLVIERDYLPPPAAAAGPDQPWTQTDAADRLVRALFAAGGDVVVVAAGRLSAVGGAAIELRY